MKKSLLAIAAMTAFAGAAQAQSSVTVYGILDVGYVGGNSRVGSSANTTQTNGTVKNTANEFGQSAEQTSRLGFKGTEDLGGGLSAFFTAEFQLYPEDNAVSGNTNNGLLNRQTFVGLKKNGVGQFAVGTQYTPVFNAGAVTSPGQYNNIIGDVIYASSSGLTSTTSNSMGTGQSGNGAGYTNRTSSTLSVASDKFAGFSANAMLTLNNKNTTEVSTPSTGVVASGGSTNASGWGLGADYTLNKFYINAAYQSLKQLTSVGNNAVSTVAGNLPVQWTQAQANGALVAGQAGSTTPTTANNVTDNQFIAGTTYDFGILKAYAQYASRKVTATASSNYFLKRSAEQIGVRSYITPTIEAWASAGLGRYTEFGQGNNTVNFNGWQLGSNYWLSKRTNLYAIYGQTLTSTGTVVPASTGVATTVSSSANNYAVGVRHTF